MTDQCSSEKDEFFDVLIVGSGHAGAHAALMLRQLKFPGRIGIIGEENSFPYERPPLSKDYLAGEKDFARLLIRPENFWEERQIELLLGNKVVAVDPLGHEVATAEGRVIGYRKLIWAAGGHPRPLHVPGSDLPGIHMLRTRTDADALRSAVPAAGSIIVVGGGYIGLETAAVFAKLGKNVVLLEALERVLARVGGAQLSRFYEDEHRSHGVDLRLGAVIASFEGSETVRGARLVDGEFIAADLIVVGIGIVPSVEPLLAAEAEGENGVMVDQFCRTSLGDIYAVGDCAAHPNAFVKGDFARLESVQNANDMAATAAKHICGIEEAYHSVPWFWSNQYDLRLQTIGVSTGFDTSALRGDPDSRSFSVLYLREGRLIAVDAVNRTKDYVQARGLIESHARVDLAQACNPSIALKDLVPLAEQE